MHKKFALVSAARSGTSLVIETLRCHPRVYVHGEIFHEKIDWHLNKEFLDTNVLSKRDSDPVGFTKDVLSQNFGRKAVGFKIWRSQSAAACEYVLRDSSIIKVILERKNKLAHYTSSELAKKTNIWNVNKKDHFGNELRNIKADFSETDFSGFVWYHKNLFEYYRSEAVGPVVELSYEQASRLEFDGLMTELDVEKLPLGHQTHKLYGTDILDRIEPEKHALVRDVLKRIKREEWLREDV